MSKQKYRWTLNKQFLALTVLPIIGLGLVIMSVASSLFSKTIIEHVNEELQNVASAVLIHFDLMYPGDYTLLEGSTPEGQTTYDLMKGGHIITQDYEYIDNIKDTCDIDITIFYQDTRILTTIYDPYGKRYIGTGAHALLVNDVLETGEAHFYPRILVNSIPYFAHYEPIYNSNGEVVGMIFAGKPSSHINSVVAGAALPIILISLIACVGVGYLSISSSRKVVYAVQKVSSFLSSVAQGNLSMNLDSLILKRKDELGDMGRSAVNMQRSLRALVEQDPLTGLNNRRYADSRLRQQIASIHGSSESFTIALGDIDFFKKVNDTYGHSAGDIVLSGVAELIKKYMAGHGYAARWGGEEFLFVFENLPYKQSLECLEAFVNELRQTTFTYKETNINVTMTIGVAICHPHDRLNILVKSADDKLYKGKSEGRDRIVT